MQYEDLLFVTGGGIRADYLITREGEAHNNQIGGNAIYSACGAALWSDSVSVWGRIGTNYPKKWIETLSAVGIDGRSLKILGGEQDHRTFYAYQADGTRDDTHPERHYARIGKAMPKALVGYRDSTPAQDDPEVLEPLALRKEDWPAHFEGEAAVHLAPLPLRTHLEIVPFLREIGVEQITLDPGERYMKPQLAHLLRRFLPLVDVFLPSAQEITSLFGPNVSLFAAAKTLADWGAKNTVIKDGSRGVLIYKQGWSDLVRMDAFHAKGDQRVIDVTGAGDSFCGGFMVGLAMNKSLEQATRFGLASASFTVEGYGAFYPLQSSKEERSDRLLVLERRAPGSADKQG